MICFHFSIFEPLETALKSCNTLKNKLWFAFILVSLNHWKQPMQQVWLCDYVVICFHFSIFEPLETASKNFFSLVIMLWFAFILVSLNHWKQLIGRTSIPILVVICFHFSIFEPLETAWIFKPNIRLRLWFAFICLSLNHWKQPMQQVWLCDYVVICFHFSIFEPLETASKNFFSLVIMLWFAFILVSLNHWKQLPVT